MAVTSELDCRELTTMTRVTASHMLSSRPGGGGILAVYMMEGSDVFFWVENLHPLFFGSRDLSHIF